MGTGETMGLVRATGRCETHHPSGRACPPRHREVHVFTCATPCSLRASLHRIGRTCRDICARL